MNTTDDLTQSLREQADRVGGHPIDLESVRGKARSIQRRRRVAAGAGVLAAVAVIAPIAVSASGGLLSDDSLPPATGPTPIGKVKAIAASAPRGDDPAIPWMDGTVLHQPDGTTTDLGKAYQEVTPYDGGWAVVDVAEGTMSFLNADGEVRETVQGQSMAVSVDGESLARAMTAVAGNQDIGLYPVAGIGPNGYLSSVVSFDGTVDLAGFTGPQEVAYTLTGMNGRSAAWLTDWEQEPRPLPSLLNVEATSQATGVVSGLTSLDEFEPGSCSAVVAVANGQTGWETCDYTLEAFSPDGRYVIGTEDYHDGIGGDTVAILDATDGTVLVEYTTRGVGFTGSSEWESNATVLVTTYQDGQWYALRLGLDGTVTQALDPVRAGDVDNPWVWGLRP
ncbi:MAG: hypothetical protein ACRDOX_07980 [Nocardioides sp.]